MEKKEMSIRRKEMMQESLSTWKKCYMSLHEFLSACEDEQAKISEIKVFTETTVEVIENQFGDDINNTSSSGDMVLLHNLVKRMNCIKRLINYRDFVMETIIGFIDYASLLKNPKKTYSFIKENVGGYVDDVHIFIQSISCEEKKKKIINSLVHNETSVYPPKKKKVEIDLEMTQLLDVFELSKEDVQTKMKEHEEATKLNGFFVLKKSPAEFQPFDGDDKRTYDKNTVLFVIKRFNTVNKLMKDIHNGKYDKGPSFSDNYKKFELSLKTLYLDKYMVFLTNIKQIKLPENKPLQKSEDIKDMVHFLVSEIYKTLYESNKFLKINREEINESEQSEQITKKARHS